MVIPGEEAALVAEAGAGEVLQDANARGQCLVIPHGSLFSSCH